MCNIFDTHAHYDDPKFDQDRKSLLLSMESKNVCGIINCGCDINSSLKSVEFSKEYPFVYAAVGYHPENIPENSEFDETSLISLIKEEKTVAIGEIGLDYYWDSSRAETQKIFFEKQLCLAEKLNMPVIIHSRDACDDTLQIIKRHNVRGVMHCFSGSVETAEEYIKLGFYLGFGGAVTFKNAKRAVSVVQAVPMDRILLETDCPYMAPEPFRGKRNDSTLIKFVAEKIAEIKKISPETVKSTTLNNAKKLFGV